jgi:SAM-dependent methyltransferase
MHDAIRNWTKDFVRKYLEYWNSDVKSTVVEVGSLDVNGNLRDLFPVEKFKYIGVDIQAGKGVDIVLDKRFIDAIWDKHDIGIDCADVVMCHQTLEHCRYPWILFESLCRTVDVGGILFITVPHKRGIHRYPIDCWRILPDAFHALVQHLADRGIFMDIQSCTHDDQDTSFIALREQ